MKILKEYLYEFDPQITPKIIWIKINTKHGVEYGVQTTYWNKDHEEFFTKDEYLNALKENHGYLTNDILNRPIVKIDTDENNIKIFIKPTSEEMKKSFEKEYDLFEQQVEIEMTQKLNLFKYNQKVLTMNLKELFDENGNLLCSKLMRFLNENNFGVLAVGDDQIFMNDNINFDVKRINENTYRFHYLNKNREDFYETFNCENEFEDIEIIERLISKYWKQDFPNKNIIK